MESQAEKSYKEMSKSEQLKEDWMNTRWRPMMGWMYMAVCVCDFILFPVLWSMTQAALHHTQLTQWNPLTLQGAGLFHIAMGAILGIAVYGRTQEKLGGVSNDNMYPNVPAGGSNPPVVPPPVRPPVVPPPVRPPVVPPAI